MTARPLTPAALECDMIALRLLARVQGLFTAMDLHAASDPEGKVHWVAIRSKDDIRDDIDAYIFAEKAK